MIRAIVGGTMELVIYIAGALVLLIFGVGAVAVMKDAARKQTDQTPRD